MFNLIRADVYKLTKLMAMKILFIVTVISSLGMTLIAYLISQGKISASMSGIGFMFSDINMISILGAVIAVIIICGDFHNKTIQEAIASGSSRSTITVTKSIIFCFSLLIIMLPYALVTIIGLAIGAEFSMDSQALGFLNLLISESGIGISTTEIWRLLITSLSLFAIYISQLSITIPLALALKKPVFIVAIYYLLSILIGQLIKFNAGSPLFDSLFNLTPFG
ncbi:MAG: ABC transporter permease, partial [bacterium]